MTERVAAERVAEPTTRPGKELAKWLAWASGAFVGVPRPSIVNEIEAAVLHAAAQADTAPGGGLAEALDSAVEEFDNIQWNNIWETVAATDQMLAEWSQKYVAYLRDDIDKARAALAEPSRDAGLREAVGTRTVYHPDGSTTVTPMLADAAADLARWLQDWAESQPAITIRRGVEPQVAWRALADELLRRWGR